MKCGNLNLLVPSGPLQACNGTALALYLFYTIDTSLDSKYYCLSICHYVVKAGLLITLTYTKHDKVKEKLNMKHSLFHNFTNLKDFFRYTATSVR